MQCRLADWATLHAGLYAAIAGVLAVATGRWRLDAAVGLVLASAALAAGSGFGIGGAGKSFSAGFGAAAAEQGLGVLAAISVAQLSQASGAGAWLSRATGRHALSRLAPAVLGLLAGPAAVPAVALAIVQPVAARLCGGRRGAATIEAALACSAAHGWLLPSPVMIAAVTILGADWRTVLLLGLPGALVLALCGVALQAALPRLPEDDEDAGRQAASAPAALGLIAASAAMLAMLTVRSLGDIPSEPLGGGSARELVIGLGRPLPLLIAGGGIILGVLGAWRLPRGRLAWDRLAPSVLVLSAAGGLQAIAQDTHMAEILAERAAAEPWGLAAPFAMAALFKLLQGSSLTAAIATAGILQPLLDPLGLGSPWGRALAALAVGAGSMAGSNVSDGFFWVAGTLSGLRADQALIRVTLPTLLQGLLGLLILVLLARM
jgi:GntP family gluconate:H+ symporter